ncbi:hypothetical protein VNI00_001167 [Paramarasmius palmivorus]|uniref:Uncharacterized protein n=1 Tax=Paramarasmius palmivorus TaxID=297713 RepID=A0AAW0E6N8_9AGAR
MKWQGENNALFVDNQRLFTDQERLEADYKRVLEAHPQADLIRQLKEKDDKISKLMSDNTELAKHNNALKQQNDELKKENGQLLKVITCSRNEATFNMLSIDYQKAMEANHFMANELHSAREEVRRVRGELDFHKNAHINVLAQVKALESAGRIAVNYAGRMPGPAAPANPVLRPSSNTASPVTPVHHAFPPNGPLPMQVVPQASAMPMMAPPTISQTSRRHTVPGVVPIRLPQPRPPQIQTQPQSQPPQPYLPTPRSTVPSPAQVLASQQPINPYPSQLVQQPRPLQVVIPSSTVPENQQFQSPSQGSAMPAYISQYLAQSPVASTSTQIQPPLPPQRHSPQTTISPSQMYTQPQYVSLSQSPSEQPVMTQVYSSPLNIQPPRQQSPAAIVPVATEHIPTSSVAGEIPSNPADAEESRNQTLREEPKPEVEVEVNAPPTPPRSYKSMSPEQSIVISSSLKRSPSPSMDFGEGSGNGLGDDRRKRMRLEETNGGAEEQAGNEATIAPETHADMGVSNTEAEGRMDASNAEAGSSTNGSLSAAAPAATAAPVAATSSPVASDTAEEEEEVQPDLQRGPDGLYKEEEIVPHMFEDGLDGASYCPFCLVIERDLDIPPRNFAGLPLPELLSHYKEKHSPILTKVCEEGLDMLYMT